MSVGRRFGGVFIASVLVCLVSAVHAEEMSKDEIISTLEKNSLGVLVDLVRKNALVLNAKGTTPNKMQLERNGAAFHEADAATAQFWYRGMGIAEVSALVSGGYSAVDWNVNSFVGIAPMFSYSQKYLTLRNPGAVVEFGTDDAAWLYTRWSTNNTCQIKAEGGGTYGLGLKGTIASCTQKKFSAPPVAALGQVFSGWMASTTVTTRVVWVLVPR